MAEDQVTAITPVVDETGDIDAYAIMDGMDNMLLDPQNAARMVAGLRPDTLVYMVPQKGGQPIIGVSANGAQVLAVRCGRLETLPDVTITEVQIPVAVMEPGGTWGEEVVQGVRAMVRVRDMRSGVTFLGIDDEPCYIMLKNGGKKPDPKASVKAVNKAERNALNKHFAALEEMVKKFAEEAIKQGKAFIVGEDGADVGASKQAAPVRRVGPPIVSKAEFDRLNQLRKDAGIKGEEFTDWLTERGIDPRAIPANKAQMIEDYIRERGKPPADADEDLLEGDAATPATRFVPHAPTSLDDVVIPAPDGQLIR